MEARTTAFEIWEMLSLRRDVIGLPLAIFMFWQEQRKERENEDEVFETLISLFERAYLLAFDTEMTEKQRRRWSSWDDYMRECCRRADFRAMLPRLLEGETLILPSTSAPRRPPRPPTFLRLNPDPWRCR